MKKIFLAIMLVSGFPILAQQQKPDTVVIELAKTSRVIFTIKDRGDLPALRQYDFQALFTDILNRVENATAVPTPTDTVTKIVVEVVPEEKKWEENDSEDEEWYDQKSTYRHRRTRHSVNMDLGMNNYLSDGKFPDENNELYTVRPWGSWYVGFNSTLRTQVAGKFFIEWGVGISWYTFKYQQDNVVMSEDDNGVVFTEDLDPLKNYSKSKISMSYVNASFIPLLDFGGYGRKARFWDSGGSHFRIGIGPYVGYRIDDHSKVVYEEDGDKEKDKNHDNFYLENFRYGVRLQIGIRSTDLFFNYDLNELYSTTKPNNPKLNAFSFGIIF